MVRSILAWWEVEWKESTILRKRKISCLAAAVVIVFCGILRGGEVFLTSPKGILRFWEYNTPRNGKSHVMVNLQG